MKFQKHLIALAAILVLSLFLRTFNLQNNLHFTGDEGRDAMIAQNIATGKEFPILGPGSSIGNISLGPLYYYLISPFSLIDKTNPIFLVIPVIFFSVATSALLYLVVVEIYKDQRAALLAALLYAIVPFSVIFGRFSWNPNIMPFFSLLYFYSLWKGVKFKNYKWIILAAFSFFVMIQSHYVSLIVLPVSVIYLWKRWKIVSIVTAMVLLLLSPLGFKILLDVVRSGGGSKLQIHYFEFLWPLIFITIAIVLSKFVELKKTLGLLVVFVLTFLMFRLSMFEILATKEPSVSGIREVVNLIENESGGKAFNFAVLSEVNREDSYKYFFQIIDARARYDNATDQLFVVCENKQVCAPHGHPKYEIAIFDVAYNGQVETVNEWNVKNFYKIVKLTPK